MGRKQTKSGKIRLTEVAKLAGVSPITASRFFRNPDALSLAKRERVDSAVKELGYVPNLAARALASHRTEVIGVVIPSLTNSVFADVLVGFSHYDASFAAISHILEQGRRRIGFLGARMDPRVQRRFDGYRDAMKAASLFDPNLIVTTTVPTTVTLGGTLFADLVAKTSDI